MRRMIEERNDCGALTGWRALELAAGNGALALRLARTFKVAIADLRRHNSLWERITEYGKLYQYGRGGRTLAPDGLWREDGRGHGCSWDPGEHSIADCIELTRIVESFNAYVGAWCDSLPQQWDEYCAEEDREALAAKRRRAARKAKETRERRYWEARDVMTQ